MMQQNGMDPQDQRNFMIAIALMVAFVFLYQVFIVEPEQAQRRAAQEDVATVQTSPGSPDQQAGIEPSPADRLPEMPVSVQEALLTAERVVFDAPRVDGSLSLRGAVLDDLSLRDHFITVERKQELRLLRPRNAEHGFYASWYWLKDGRAFAGPQDNWQLVEGNELTVATPITLRLEKDDVAITRQILVDEDYLFTYQDTITNLSDDSVALTPYGSVRRHGAWKAFLEATDPGSSKKMGLAHQGLIGVLDGKLKLRDYNNLAKGRGIKGAETDRTNLTSGWLGFTDMYWMTALVPEQGATYDAAFNLRGGNEGIFEVSMMLAPVIVAPGAEASIENAIFAGAKEYEVVNAYKAAGIPRFDDSIDWGTILYYITRPFFALLNWLKMQIGSFGLAILALTLLIKIPLIPLYNQSYKSMAKMKKLAEPMKEIQERFKADPQRRQQEIMKLYQREKANPLAGCVPILLTIPVFFALYKTLYVTIEMRHTPFLFLQDLSAPDPTAIANLFGLLPIAAADIKAIPLLGLVIGIGILPILYGVTMAGIQALSPPPPDPTQRTIMMALPFVFMFVFGGFASGLVLYWVWSNILSLMQQYYIMRRNGVETELDKLIKRLFGRAPSSAE